MNIKAKRVRVRLSMDTAIYGKRSRMVDAYVLNRVFVAHYLATLKIWRVTHRLSGYSAGNVATFGDARRYAAALVKQTGRKAWLFRDGQHVWKNRETFAGCKDISKRFRAEIYA